MQDLKIQIKKLNISSEDVSPINAFDENTPIRESDGMQENFNMSNKIRYVPD